MKPFAALLRHELLLLLRQNVIGIAVATVVIYAAALYFLPKIYHDTWVPALLMSEIVTMGVLFIAAVVFIEIRQQTVIAFAVTPVPTTTWILAKLTAFTLLSTGAAQALLILQGSFPNGIVVTVAIVLSALLYNQIGFILAVLTGNIRDFFLPLSLVMGLLALSVYWHLGVADSPLFWIIPSYPAMVLLASGATPAPAATLALALLLLLLWNAATFWLCRHVFRTRICSRLGR
ncbi:hypothetical protein [Tahibacter sp.]|uniref:fluoroquinolone export ABC transporter permease subunit n=1 Tax=Tahibacter sp. TaxID=2056211 RepID=UPI0028C43ABB|nr:hypothetical protein [Tahibacter sp.]